MVPWNTVAEALLSGDLKVWTFHISFALDVSFEFDICFNMCGLYLLFDFILWEALSTLKM